MPDLAFLSSWLSWPLETHRKVLYMDRTRVSWSVLEKVRLLTPVGVLQAPELAARHCQSVYLCSVTKYSLGINTVQGDNSSCFSFPC